MTVYEVLLGMELSEERLAALVRSRRSKIALCRSNGEGDLADKLEQRLNHDLQLTWRGNGSAT